MTPRTIAEAERKGKIKGMRAMLHKIKRLHRSQGICLSDLMLEQELVDALRRERAKGKRG